LEALVALDKTGIDHRDIKPAKPNRFVAISAQR
jgi:hypothetical protein